jgi:hypothetical protein
MVDDRPSKEKKDEHCSARNENKHVINGKLVPPYIEYMEIRSSSFIYFMVQILFFGSNNVETIMLFKIVIDVLDYTLLNL